MLKYNLAKPTDRALPFVRDALRSGDIPAKYFSMGLYGDPECGVPGCIWGWTGTLLRKAGYVAPYEAPCALPDRLWRLFHPVLEMCERAKIDTDQAAVAIDRYLEGLTPIWTQEERKAWWHTI